MKNEPKQLLLDAYNGKAVTTSMKFAEVFGIAHDEVLSKINGVEYSESFIEENFVPVSLNGDDGVVNGFYITYDGFSVFAGEFYGRIDMSMVEKYLVEFGNLTKYLRMLRSIGQHNYMIH